MAGMTVQAWQQLAGANVVVYYLTYIAQMAGLAGNVAMVTSGVQYAVFIIFTGVMWLFIDKTGRRTLLIWGALGMFTPPAFVNITWRLFIIFGVLCVAAAGWSWVFYPETCGKTLEEVEVLFSNEGPKPWKTKKGDSRLIARIEAVVAKKTQEDPDVHVAPAAEKESA